MFTGKKLFWDKSFQVFTDRGGVKVWWPEATEFQVLHEAGTSSETQTSVKPKQHKVLFIMEGRDDFS